MASDHRVHDLGLVAAFAVDDARGVERERALALTAGCPDCALLAADLRAISAAVRADAATQAVAPRDFRLSPEAARKLRGGSLGARLRRDLGIGGGALRPFGATLATLGLVGLLVSGGPFGGSPAALTGGASGGGAQSGYDTRSNPAPSSAAKDLSTAEAAFGPLASPAYPAAAPSSRAGQVASQVPPSASLGSPAPASPSQAGSAPSQVPAPTPAADVVRPASGVALALGVGLLLVTFRRRPRRE
jgi:hypothetical protein